MDIKLTCEMVKGCPDDVTMIDCSGWIYCTRHGLLRRSWKPCRKLRPHELKRLWRGEQVPRY